MDQACLNQQNYWIVVLCWLTRELPMSYEPPAPPANLPTEIVNTLNESTPERLRNIARYAEELAEHKERKARLEEKSDEDDIKGAARRSSGRCPRKGDDHDQGNQRQPLLLLTVARGESDQVQIQGTGQLRQVERITVLIVGLTHPVCEMILHSVEEHPHVRDELTDRMNGTPRLRNKRRVNQCSGRGAVS